jgi:tryptophan-rich sensory protein
VWTFLYLIIAASFGRVFLMAYQNKIPMIVVLPFVLNLIYNVIFTPIQFGLKNNILATVDITLVLLTIIWMMVAIYPHARWITYAQIPYLLWVSFATILQITITILNR